MDYQKKLDFFMEEKEKFKENPSFDERLIILMDAIETIYRIIDNDEKTIDNFLELSFQTPKKGFRGEGFESINEQLRLFKP